MSRFNVYVIDTHALSWWLTDDPKLGRKARKLLDDIESGYAQGIIPIIVLAEELWIVEKKQRTLARPLTFSDVLSNVKRIPTFSMESWGERILRRMARAGFIGLELHDWSIVTTAAFHRATVITNDRDIINSGQVPTVW